MDAIICEKYGIVLWLIGMQNVKFFQTHTCLHNWSLQPFKQHYNLASYTTYVASVNFAHGLQDLHFKVDSVLQFFWETFFMFFFLFYLLSEFLSEICWAEVAVPKFFHNLIFLFLLNYKTIRNYNIIIYELSNFHVVSQTPTRQILW